DLGNPGWQRRMSIVRKSAELIMIVEASNPNFFDQSGSTSQPTLYMRRLGARHGKKTADGRNAYTNFAFFDGHVALFPTVNFNYGPSNNIQWPADKFAQETIFWVGKQKG